MEKGNGRSFVRVEKGCRIYSRDGEEKTARLVPKNTPKLEIFITKSNALSLQWLKTCCIKDRQRNVQQRRVVALEIKSCENAHGFERRQIDEMEPEMGIEKG